jgi:hypothetical protein
MNLCNGEKLQAIAPVLSEAEEEGQVAETIRYKWLQKVYLFQRRNSHYEKINHSHFCAFDRRLGAGVLLKQTRDDHDHNASNHCHVGASAFDGKNAYA